MGEIEYETPNEIKDLFKAFRNIFITMAENSWINTFNLRRKVPYVILWILYIRLFWNINKAYQKNGDS